ncbi:thioesterase II family protein [Salinispora arenicola]|uniref:thioesterase II family protein n=1 Tax=Salinispora arenicola TaxID=168697 RepID=UPI000372718F|nr:alpha/beta fold hydrolase [Salinispora arenicola]
MSTKQFSLVCLPFAGSGASVYRGWSPAALEGRAHLVPVQLPGREELFGEEPFEDVQETATHLAAGVLEELDEASPIVLFGHSLGAVIAYEMAYTIEQKQPGRLRRLYVSGSGGPEAGRTDRATGLGDEEFLDRVRQFAGYRHDALDVPELREVLLPVLRADVAMHENYRPTARDPLSVPITALRGTDDHLVAREEAVEWAATTRVDFVYQELPGGHMYLVEEPEPLLRVLSGALL